MNVKEVVSVLKAAHRITLMYGDNYVDFLRNDAIMVDSFGKYVVDSVQVVDGTVDHYEINIAMRPVVEER